MMPQTVPNSPTYGLVLPTVASVARPCSRRSISLQLRHAHGAPRALQQLIRRRCALAQPGELAKAELEDAGHAGRAAGRLDRAVQLRQIVPGPEAVLEAIGLALRAADHARSCGR